MNPVGLDSLRTTETSIMCVGESSSDVYISISDVSGLVGGGNLPPDRSLAWSWWTSLFYELPEWSQERLGGDSASCPSVSSAASQGFEGTLNTGTRL